MENMDSGINNSLPSPEDSFLSDGEVADPDHAAIKSTSTVTKTFDALPVGDFGGHKEPNGVNSEPLLSSFGRLLFGSADGVSETGS